MTDLSPAAQAVLEAYAEHNGGIETVLLYERQAVAAVLRAAADQVVPLHICGTNATRAQTRLGIRHKLLAIATELEASDA
jgi:hypothetical protein